MKYEELAFLNQQLAGMLKSGMPLEGALRQLTADMAGGELRDELTALESDLKGGTPLEEALAARRLPPLYVSMVRVGARGNDMSGALTLLADYYTRMHSIWTRLKGLLVYPMLVLLMALAVSTLIAAFGWRFAHSSGMLESDIGWASTGPHISKSLLLSAWFPPAAVLLLLGAVAVVMTVPRFRTMWRWRVPGFKEAGLSQLASSLSMLLRSGVNLKEAIALVRGLEPSALMKREMARWEERLASGRSQITELIVGKGVVPPLFVWLVANAGEDLATGFGRAADLYHARAMHRIEMILYCVLPASILMLGLMILGQMIPLVQAFVRFMKDLT